MNSSTTELWYQALPTPLQLRPWGPFHNTSTLQLSNLSNIPSFVCSDITNQNKSFRMAAHFENRGKAVHRFLHFLKIVELQRSRTQTRKHSQRDSEQQQLPADELLLLQTKYLTTAHELTRKPHNIRTKTDRSFILKVRVVLLWYINTQKNGTDPSSLVFISHRLLLIYSRVEATNKPKWPQKHCLCRTPRTTSGVFESTLLYFAYSNKYWVSIEMGRRWIPTDIQTAACGDKPSACTSCFITFPLQQHAHTHSAYCVFQG